MKKSRLKEEKKPKSGEPQEKKKKRAAADPERQASPPPKRQKKKAEVAERTWNDFKQIDPQDLERGPFTADELKRLQESIVEYCHSNRLTEEGSSS